MGRHTARRTERERGVDGLATMPPEWWTELAALEDAGARCIGLFRRPSRR